MRSKMRLTVVIPIWNDPAALREILATIASLRGVDEVIIGDASISDDCAQIATAAGARLVRCAKPGRGQQMNAAASMATGDVILFQHADTDLRQAHLDSLLAAMSEPDVHSFPIRRSSDYRKSVV